MMSRKDMINEQSTKWIKPVLILMFCLCIQIFLLQNKLWKLEEDLNQCVLPSSAIDEESIRNTLSILGRERVSELLMSLDVQKYLDFNSSKEHETSVVIEPALSMFTVQLIEADPSLRENRILSKLQSYGMVVFKSVLDPILCRKSAIMVHELIISPGSRYSTVMGRLYRKDVALPLREPFLSVVSDTLDVVGHALKTLLGGNAQLMEFASMTSYPGAQEQLPHADSLMEEPKDLLELGKLITVFVYLDHVDSNMGPLDVWPATHSHYQFLPTEERLALGSGPLLRVAVGQGSIVMYDSRVEHRGAANTSNKVRPALYMTFLESGKTAPKGSTYTLQENYVDNVTLDMLLNRLEGLETLDPEPVLDTTDHAQACRTLLDEKCASWNMQQDECIRCANAVEQGTFEQGQAVCHADYMEKLCRVGIFAEAFHFQVSWGPLSNYDPSILQRQQ